MEEDLKTRQTRLVLVICGGKNVSIRKELSMHALQKILVKTSACSDDQTQDVTCSHHMLHNDDSGKGGDEDTSKKVNTQGRQESGIKEAGKKNHVFEPRVMTGVLTTPPINGNGSRSHRKGFVSLLIRRASVCVCVCGG